MKKTTICPFEVGQIITAIDNCNGCLTIGKSYRIDCIFKENGIDYIEIIDDMFEEHLFRFEEFKEFFIHKIN